MIADEIVRAIERVPADTARMDLADYLDPIIAKMAALDPARAEALLSMCQFRFKLKKAEADAYRRMLRLKQKELESTPTGGLSPQNILTADFPGLVDIVLDQNEKPMFLVLENGRPVVLDAVERDGVRYVVPGTEQLPWLLPRACEVQRWYQADNDLQLYEDLLAYHREISELPADAYYDLVVAWVIHTYLLESVQYSPILWFHAVPERGKSRTGKGMIYVARRGIHVESLREAYLLRVAQDLKATLFIDVMDLSRKLDRSGSEDIVLLRFEKGAKVPRVLYPERGPFQDTVYYEIFGATIIGTNEPIHQILESRSIPFIQRQSHRSFENEVTPEGGRALRERLVALRARHLGTGLPNVAKPMPGRLGDILKPLLQVVMLVNPDRVPVLDGLFQELQAARLVRKSESLEAQILLALQACGALAIDGLVPVGDVADHLNRDRSDKERVTNHRVGRRLNALGFEKTRTGRNYAAVVWDPERLARVMAAYGLQETPETPGTPGSLSCKDLQSGVSPNDSQETSQLFGDHREKLRPVTPLKLNNMESDGVSGVSGRFSGTGLHPSTERADSEDFEEDAAILEYDGGLPRAEAEARARAGRNGDER